MSQLSITLTQKDSDLLQTYSALINKDKDTMVSEAFKLYFEMLEEKLQQDQTSETSLDFDEFWEGVDI